MSDYPSEYTSECPYCNAICEADFCDVGIGMIQCGPFHCMQCGASQIGSYDNYYDPFRPLYQPPNKDKNARVLTQLESDTHWYEPNTSPGSSANVIGGQIVSHKVMETTYKREFTGNVMYEDKDYVDNWWDNIRV